MNQNETLSLINAFVNEHRQMTIATFGNHPWIATVYYAVDQEWNLYFLSNPATLHGQQIAMNAQVAVAISDSPQAPPEKKKGVQIYGEARLLSNEAEVTQALQRWKETLQVANDDYSYQGMQNNRIKGRMYKVAIKKIKFFNQELWIEGEEPLLEI